MAAKMNLNDLISPEKTDPGHSSIRKVIIWGREDLLSQAVSRVLEAGRSWEILRVSSTENIEKLIQKIQTTKPEVVILCQDGVKEDSILPMKVINAQSRLKVVSLSLANNLIQVYSKTDVMVQGGMDLLSIIEPENSSVWTPGKEA